MSKIVNILDQREPETISFKEKLLQRETCKKEREAEEHIRESVKLILDLRSCLSSFKFYAVVMFLQRSLNQLLCDTEWTHERKLRSLYKGKVYLPRDSNNIVNLSDYTLDKHEESLLNKGLKFGMKKKTEPIDASIQAEKLFYDILSKERQNKNEILDIPDLKIKLSHFSLAGKKPDTAKENLTNEEHAALKALRSNSDIVIKRPDKGAGVVIMKKRVCL